MLSGRPSRLACGACVGGEGKQGRGREGGGVREGEGGRRDRRGERGGGGRVTRHLVTIAGQHTYNFQFRSHLHLLEGTSPTPILESASNLVTARH